jgi:hypothetical protein
MTLKYIMRAYKTTPTTGLVYWTVTDAPDTTGSQSPYSPADLQNITVNATYEVPIPTSGIQFAGLIENPAGNASFQRITSDMVFPPFVVTLSGGTNLEVNQTVVNPTFTAAYSGSTPVSAVLSNNFDGYTVTGTTPFTSFPTTHSYQKIAYGQSVTFTVTANNGSINKTGISTYTWLQKVFYGVGIAGQNSESFIEALATQPIASTRSRTFTVNPTSQKIYYAHRTAYGLLAPTDFVVGGFAGGFTNTATVTITNAFGFTENYYVYESDNLLTGSTTITVS